MSIASAKGFSHPARQERSRQTEARLLAAVVGVLRKTGLAGCSVPMIAKEAGVAVGTVYRRYPDKDGLLADAILSTFEVFDREGAAAVGTLVQEAGNLGDALEQICRNLIAAAIVNRTLVRAMRDFAQSYQNPSFQNEYTRLKGKPREILFAHLWARFSPEIIGGEFALRTALAAMHGAVQAIYTDKTPGLFPAAPDPDAFAKAVAEMQTQFLTANGKR